jgi:hypothetical protein
MFFVRGFWMLYHGPAIKDAGVSYDECVEETGR